jgi:hypothetical protein
MLSFRMILVTIAAGVCLWGLFALLENLREPELLRSPKVIVVKGCEPMESDEAIRLCPHLQCQKALLDSKQVPLSTRFQVTADERRRRPETGQAIHVIAGTASSPDPVAMEVHFECELEDGRVLTAKVM